MELLLRVSFLSASSFLCRPLIANSKRPCLFFHGRGVKMHRLLPPRELFFFFFFIALESFYLTSCKLLRAVEAIKLPSFTFTEVDSQCSARRMKQFPPISIKCVNGAAQLRTSEAWSSPGLKRCARYSKVYKGSHVGSLNFRGDGQESKSPEEEGNVALIFSIQWGLGWVGPGHVSISSIKRCWTPSL